MVTLGGILGSWSASAQSFTPFGPLSSAGDSDTSPVLPIDGQSAIKTHVDLAGTVNFTPSYGTPAGATETYTVTWRNVTLNLISASGGLLPSEPVTLDLGTISKSFTVTLPATKPPSSYPTYNFNFSVSQNFSTDYVAPILPGDDNFAVTLNTIGVPTFIGGKTPDNWSASLVISGTLGVDAPTGIGPGGPMVPEPASYAAAVGTVLMGFGLVRRWNRV